MKLSLYTAAQNSAGERVRIALNLKGFDYDYVPVPRPKDPAYVQRNPQALMPTLEVDGIHISQSLSILEYLEERCPDPPLLPKDPILRTQSRSFAMAICAETHALTVRRVRRFLMEDMAVGPAKVDEWYAHWTQVTFSALETKLCTRTVQTDFCFDQFPTFADIALIPQMANARRFDCDLSAFPRLCEIEARCRSHIAFERARPEAQIDDRNAQ